MKILLASSEVHPFSKTGGLADMVAALGKNLARKGHRVGLVTPLYAGVRDRFPEIKTRSRPFSVQLGAHRINGKLATLEPVPGLTIYFIDHPGFFDRPGLYQHDGRDYHDNAERFLFFSKAVVHLAETLSWQPEIVHVHDWQVAMVPLMIQHEAKTKGWGKAPRTCTTIHNLAYQGLFPVHQFHLTNLPWEFFNSEGVEFYGQFGCLKAGIAFSDAITTVSPTYAREITTVEYGCGLDGFLRKHHSKLTGILNGVDYDEWNTTNNPHIRFPYSISDLDGKQRNKAALQAELGLPVNASVPLFGSINRLVEQKGVDIQLGALEEMLESNIQFVLLGSGNPAFEAAYQDLARRHPGKVAVRIGYNHALSHRIEAGSDFFLLPSRFEPCGLNQMYSLRYGSVPIVRSTGGLDDTVVDFLEDPDRADGVKFKEYSSPALAKAIRKAIAIYSEPELLAHYRQNGMSADFSWERTVTEYEQLFARIL